MEKRKKSDLSKKGVIFIGAIMSTYIQTSAMKDIVHMDLDTFFVSVERILDPNLNHRPVIVGGSPLERGVVAGCSYEARVFGIHCAIRAVIRLSVLPIEKDSSKLFVTSVLPHEFHPIHTYRFGVQVVVLG